MEKIFDSDRRIRLGIWGLGRGGSFVKAAGELNVDIVAGCDINPLMREKFSEICPEAKVTGDEKEFLANKDMDAVLIATFFSSHAEHTIMALEAGFHVMCEVTSFFTPAEGVRVVEAVEKSGKVYNLLENYPFTKENMYLAKLWQEGFFGEFTYGEFEYLHECRGLCYSYNMPGSPPVEPGYSAHSWRSWLDFHYYNTHSLGPLMKITGLRPEKISAFPHDVPLPGYLPGSGMSKPCPSLIKMSNGGIMRNLCGATTGNYHTGKRIWGTLAAAESLTHGLFLQLGAGGNALKVKVDPQWPELADIAETAGHGGGDFWELYYFVREILTGEKAPWDIYSACDVTLAGIMAVISCGKGGEVQEIPDFRDAAVREKFRNDHRRMDEYELNTIFPAGHDTAISGKFTAVMTRLHKFSSIWRKGFDGARIFDEVAGAEDKLKIIAKLNEAENIMPELSESRETAAAIIAAYPDCKAAAALRSMLSLTDAEFNTQLTPRTVIGGMLKKLEK